jgi:hypothetical protein
MATRAAFVGQPGFGRIDEVRRCLQVGIEVA